MLPEDTSKKGRKQDKERKAAEPACDLCEAHSGGSWLIPGCVAPWSIPGPDKDAGIPSSYSFQALGKTHPGPFERFQLQQPEGPGDAAESKG